jgi:hypothetical protein
MRIMPRAAGNENFEMRGAVSSRSILAGSLVRSHMILYTKRDVDALRVVLSKMKRPWREGLAREGLASAEAVHSCTITISAKFIKTLLRKLPHR